MIRHSFRPVMLAALVLIVAGVYPREARGQLITQHVKGSVGLKAGSQPPPGGYIIAPVLYIYTTDTVKDRDGNKLPFNADLTSAFFGVGYSQVTTKKVLAATTVSRSCSRWAPITAYRGLKSTPIPAPA